MPNKKNFYPNREHLPPDVETSPNTIRSSSVTPQPSIPTLRQLPLSRLEGLNTLTLRLTALAARGNTQTR